MGVDPQDERMIGIPGGFGVIDAATGFSGSTNAVFDKWVHVKYAYDFDARKISVEYDGTTLAAEEPSNGDFDNLGILGIVFENSSAKDMKYWIDNLKITNKASAVVDTKTGFTEYDFENYSQTWGRYVGEVSSVEADKEHGSSLSLRIDDSANGWIYRYFEEKTNGTLTFKYSVHPNATDDKGACSHNQVFFANNWNCGNGQYAGVEFYEDGHVTSGGSTVGSFEFDKWYKCETTINIDTTEMTTRIWDSEGEMVGLPVKSSYAAGILNCIIVKNYHGKNGMLFDDLEVTYRDANPTVDAKDVIIYDYDDEIIEDMDSVPVSAQKIKIDFGASINPDTIGVDNVYLISADGRKVKTSNSVLGRVCTICLDEKLETETEYELFLSKNIANNEENTLGENIKISIITAPGTLETFFEAVKIAGKTVDISKFKGGTQFNVTLEMVNTLKNKQIPYLVTAYYDEGYMVDITYTPIEIDSEKTGFVCGTVSLSETVPRDIAYFDTIKMFLWSKDNLAPYAGDIEIGLIKN